MPPSEAGETPAPARSSTVWRTPNSTPVARHCMPAKGPRADRESQVRGLPMSAMVEQGDHVVVPECGESIHDRFGRIAADLPDAVAVRSDRGTVTYAELDRHSDLIARRIINVSEGSKAPVGLLLGHDDRMVAGILGALKAGRPYLPLDPRSPQERLAGTLADSGPSALVCDPEWERVAWGLSPRGMPIVD